MPTMREHAEKYIAQGMPVFPCCWPVNGACGCGRKHEGRDVGKVPLVEHGLKDATQTVTGVKDYWTRWPNASIGLAIPAGYFVLDVDIDKQGYESLEKLQNRYDALTETWLVITGSCGQHYWYKTPKQVRNTTRLDGLDGLDVRGEGGYVIAPPSLHRSGHRYAVSYIWDGPIMPAPLWLVEVCTKKQAPITTNTNTVNPIPEGSRNDALARDAGAMRRRGFSEEAIFNALKIANRERCQPPLPEDEIMRIAKSVSRYAPEPGTTPTPATAKFRGGVTV